MKGGKGFHLSGLSTIHLGSQIRRTHADLRDLLYQDEDTKEVFGVGLDIFDDREIVMKHELTLTLRPNPKK